MRTWASIRGSKAVVLHIMPMSQIQPMGHGLTLHASCSVGVGLVPRLYLVPQALFIAQEGELHVVTHQTGFVCIGGLGPNLDQPQSWWAWPARQGATSSTHPVPFLIPHAVPTEPDPACTPPICSTSLRVPPTYTACEQGISTENVLLATPCWTSLVHWLWHGLIRPWTLICLVCQDELRHPCPRVVVLNQGVLAHWGTTRFF